MSEVRQSVLGSRLYRSASASASLYLEWSCQDMLDNGDLVQLSPTVFRHRDTVIVIRHVSGLKSLPDHKHLIYVIDDDWRGGLADASLPPMYRLQLAVEFTLPASRIERGASVILVASDKLEQKYSVVYPWIEIRRIEPAWPSAKAPLPSECPQTIAYLSAWTHLADSRFLKPVIESILNARPEVRFTLSSSFDLPRSWQSEPRIKTLPRMNWSHYWHWLQDKSFDIGLYAMNETPFNEGRSVNKLMEYDQVGAAILASDNWTAGAAAANAKRFNAVGNTIEDWTEALLRLIDTPGLARTIAKRNRDTLAEENPLASQRHLWRHLFDEFG